MKVLIQVHFQNMYVLKYLVLRAQILHGRILSDTKVKKVPLTLLLLKTLGVGLNADIDASFSDSVNVVGNWHNNSWSLSRNHRAAVSDGPQYFSLVDKAGCSCEQIVAEQGLGKRHLKNGSSVSLMKVWADQFPHPLITLIT